MPNDPVNTGPRPATIDGKKIMLTSLSAEAFSAIAAHVVKNKVPASVYDKVLASIDKVPEHLQEKMLDKAMRADHEEAMRDRFNEVTIPKHAFFDDDVLAMILSLAASVMQPEYTLERCTEIVTRVGAFPILAQIMWVFPQDSEKKDQGSSDKSAPGPDSTGPNDAPSSSLPAKESSTSND